MLLRSRLLILCLTLLTFASCQKRPKKLIGVVPKVTSHLFFVSIHAGVDAAAKEFGVDILWNGPREETEYSRQIEIVDSMIGPARGRLGNLRHGSLGLGQAGITRHRRRNSRSCLRFRPRPY
jgi:ABC-type sugar transport system substrate-binding protein